jgi:hypothetical protein
MRNLIGNVRYAARQFRLSPVLVSTAVLTLALGEQEVCASSVMSSVWRSAYLIYWLSRGDDVKSWAAASRWRTSHCCTKPLCSVVQ